MLGKHARLPYMDAQFLCVYSAYISIYINAQFLRTSQRKRAFEDVI